MEWFITLYVVPTVALILFSLYDGENPFKLGVAEIVFTPIVNINYFLLLCFFAILAFLVSWEEFIEDIFVHIKKFFFKTK